MYMARLAKPVGQHEMALFASGQLVLDTGSVCRPAELKPHPSNPTLVRVTVMEGMQHQVRRMFRAVDNKVLALHRTGFGPMQLNTLGLEPGQWRQLTGAELRALLSASELPAVTHKHQQTIDRLAAIAQALPAKAKYGGVSPTFPYAPTYGASTDEVAYRSINRNRKSDLAAGPITAPTLLQRAAEHGVDMVHVASTTAAAARGRRAGAPGQAPSPEQPDSAKPTRGIPLSVVAEAVRRSAHLPPSDADVVQQYQQDATAALSSVLGRAAPGGEPADSGNSSPERE